MTMRRMIAAALATLALASCASMDEARAKREARKTYQDLFYMKYLDPGSWIDQQIEARVMSLRTTPNSPTLHNELGAFLFKRKFPKDARHEFEKAIDLDRDFYPAWYNLALVHLAEGNDSRAVRCLKKALDAKPGHAESHFELGLLYERRGRTDAAIDHYSKAFGINRDLLDPKKNAKIVECGLVTRALLASYEANRALASTRFLAAPSGYTAPPVEEPKPKSSTPAEPKQSEPKQEEAPSAPPTVGPVGVK